MRYGCGLMLVAMWVSGCGWGGGTSAGKVAVVDLDEVARRLGRSQEMEENVAVQQSNLNEQLVDLQTNLRKQLLDRQQELGDNPGDDGSQELVVLQTQLNTTLNTERNRAIALLAGYRQTLVSKFKEEVKPVAMKIAAERGMSIVVTKNDAVIYAIDPACEITEAVVGQMVSAGKKAESPGKLPENEQAAPLTAAAPEDNPAR